MKPEIIPALLAHTPKELKEQWAVFQKLKPKMVQVDVCDGKFAGKKTVSADEVQKLQLPAFEVDLMVAKPAQAALEWILAGAQRVIFHIEATDDAQVVVDLCRLYNKEVGIALKPGTPISKIISLVPLISRVQLKGVHPGKSGQKLIPAVVRKISALHKKFPDLIIAVDGGVNRETVGQLAASGVKSFAVSSALLQAADPAKELKQFKKLIS